jgi:branched-chain amino acid transport system substrate-binding protein
MVYDEEPLALIGSVDSASTHLAEQVVAKANLPLVSPITTDQSVTLAGVSWMFSCAPADDVIARVLVDGVLAELAGAAGGARMQSAALFSSTDHQSRMTAGEVLREFSRHGRLPDFRYEVSPGTADITRQLEAVAGAGPCVVIIIADAADSARLLRSVRTMIPGTAVFGGPAMGRSRFLELAGPAAEGVRFPVLSGPDPGDRDYARFADRFWVERGGTPDYAAVLVYDATRLLLEAVRRAGSNRVRIREALLELSPWRGLAGPIQFDGTGQNTRANLRLGTIRNGMVVAGTS